ncbi:hypothetical protein HELRODRAFT_129617, partial [Helobdella robusta]|uniref:Gastrin/cholecystokinin type B receptor n=1 Tax=Helobdella robusta TaxID=6412 RepID=T1EHR7_HELRO
NSSVSGTSRRPHQQPQQSKHLLPQLTIPSYIIIFLLAVIGNALVVMTLANNRNMRTITNIFLLNLSISDMLLAVFCMPFTLIPTLMQDFIFGYVVCKLVRYLQGLVVGVCVFTHVTISLERFWAICQPLKSRKWQTRRHCYKMLVLIWLGAILITIPTGVSHQIVSLRNAKKCVEMWTNKNLEIAYVIILLFLLFILPLVVMFVAYGCIAATLFCGMSPQKFKSYSFISRRTNTDNDLATAAATTTTTAAAKAPTSLTTNTSNSINRSRRKSVLMLFIVVSEFFICWAPLYIMETWTIISPQTISRPSPVVMNLIHLLAFISSCCNPITYCFMSKKFRAGFVGAFGKCCKCLVSRSVD